jgi:hypothetical protein
MTAATDPIVLWCGRFTKADGYGTVSKNHLRGLDLVGARFAALDLATLGFVGPWSGAGLEISGGSTVTIRAKDPDHHVSGEVVDTSVGLEQHTEDQHVDDRLQCRVHEVPEVAQRSVEVRGVKVVSGNRDQEIPPLPDLGDVLPETGTGEHRPKLEVGGVHRHETLSSPIRRGVDGSTGGVSMSGERHSNPGRVRPSATVSTSTNERWG